MGSTNRRQPTPLADALQLFAYLVLFALTILLLWGLESLTLSWQVRGATYLTAAFSLAGLSLMAATHTVRLIGGFVAEVRRQIRRCRK